MLPSIRYLLLTTACLRVKDGLCDCFRAHFNQRPSVDLNNPSIRFYLYWNRGTAILYRDLAGGSLHRRGYRDVMHKSSLNESLAAAMVLISQWDGTTPLADPMCGSGTLAIEAALIALNRAPGLMRRERFHLENWQDTDLKRWREIRKEAAADALAGTPDQIAPIMANDLHPGALSLARKDAISADVAHVIKFSSSDAESWNPETKPGLVLVNPPWGERLDHEPEVAWQKLGQFLKSQCEGANAIVLCGNREMTRNLRLKASRKFPITVGSIDCRILQYQIH